MLSILFTFIIQTPTMKTALGRKFDLCGALFARKFTLGKHVSICQYKHSCQFKLCYVSWSSSSTQVDGCNKLLLAVADISHADNNFEYDGSAFGYSPIDDNTETEEMLSSRDYCHYIRCASDITMRLSKNTFRIFALSAACIIIYVSIL